MLERLLEQPEAVAVVRRRGEHVTELERSRARRPVERRGQQLIDDRTGATVLVDVREVARLSEPALGQRDLLRARGEPTGVLHQDRRGVRGTACPGVPGCLFERFRDLVVRPLGRKRKVPSPLLHVVGQPGTTPMQLAPARRGDPGVHG